MSTSERLRKGATGLCLIAAPLGLLIGIVLHPAESRDAAQQLAIIGADADRWAMAHYVITVAAILLAGAVVGLAHLIHERRPGQAIGGGALGLVGAVSLGAVAFAEATFGSELGRRSGDPAAVDAFGAVMASPASVLILVGALMGPLGSIVLGHGLYRSGVVPRWTAIALMVGAACLLVGLPTNLMPVVIAGAALMLLALAPIGVMVVGETDEEWMHTPARASA